jgi:chromosome partitioning protein
LVDGRRRVVELSPTDRQQMGANSFWDTKGITVPTIVFATPKGGAGKSTSAIILGTELVSMGTDVTIIDADPNKPVSRWSNLPGKPANLKVIDDVTERNIIRIIDDEITKAPFVIVDLEGTASRIVTYAMSRADLVIIPTQGSALDAVEAVSALREVKQQEEAFRIKIPAAILFTRTNPAVRGGTLKSIEQEFFQNQVPVFNTPIHDREAYRALFSVGGTLSGFPRTKALDASIKNARTFVHEVVEMLKAANPNNDETAEENVRVAKATRS